MTAATNLREKPCTDAEEKELLVIGLREAHRLLARWLAAFGSMATSSLRYETQFALGADRPSSESDGDGA